jgi:hypothetical protein
VIFVKIICHHIQFCFVFSNPGFCIPNPIIPPHTTSVVVGRPDVVMAAHIQKPLVRLLYFILSIIILLSLQKDFAVANPLDEQRGSVRFFAVSPFDPSKPNGRFSVRL